MDTKHTHTTSASIPGGSIHAQFYDDGLELFMVNDKEEVDDLSVRIPWTKLALIAILMEPQRSMGQYIEETFGPFE